MKIPELIKAIQIQIPEASKSIRLLGSPDRPNSWTFDVLDTSGNRRVVKVIKPFRTEDADGRNEEEALERIKKRKDINAIHYISKSRVIFKSEDLPTFIFPYIDGTDLDQLIAKNGPLSEDEVLRFLEQITSTILKLAGEGVIHQDIKPGNIKTTKDGTYLLLDLGIARFIDHGFKLLKQQGPARYLSPEQVLLGQAASDYNKRRVTFLSDIYSAGVVAIALLTGKDFGSVWKTDRRHLVSAELRRGVLLPIKNDLLRNKLANYLELSPSCRMKYLHEQIPSGLKFVEEKKMGMPLFWNLHHSVTGINLLSEFAQDNPDIRGGGILLAETIRSVENSQKITQDLQTRGWKIAVDPSTYKLTYLQEHHAYLKNRPYFRDGMTNMSFVKPGFAQQFVSEVIAFQDEYNPDYYISPYFYVNDTTSNYLELNFSLHDIASQQLGTKTTDHPLLFGLALSSDLLMDQQKVTNLLDQLFLYPKAQGYFLRCELIKTNNSPCANEKYLEGLLRLISRLSISKTLLMSQVDQSVLGLLANTRLSFAINPDPSARKLDIDSKLSTSQPGGGPKKEDRRIGYYLPPILADLDLQREFNATIRPKLGAAIECGCKYCRRDVSGIDMKEQNRHKHFLLNFYGQAKSITQAKQTDRKKVYAQMVTQAESIYDQLGKLGVKLSTESKGTFLTTWRKVFCS